MDLERKSGVQSRNYSLLQRHMDNPFGEPEEKPIFPTVKSKANKDGFKKKIRIYNLDHFAFEIGGFVEEFGYAEGTIKASINQSLFSIEAEVIYEIMNLKYKEDNVQFKKIEEIEGENIYQVLTNRLEKAMVWRKHNHEVMIEGNKIIILKKYYNINKEQNIKNDNLFP